MIEAVERQKVVYTNNEKDVDKALRSAFFHSLNEVRETYELESRKSKIAIDRPFQVGIAVYQLAKLRMLEFYYDFLDKFIHQHDFELIQMDTDSNYFAISGEKLEDVIRPKLREGFNKEKKQMAGLERMERAGARSFQVGMRMLENYCFFFKMLFCRSRRKRGGGKEKRV